MNKDLQFFKDRLIRENEHQNLVSRKTTPEELDSHIADAGKLLDFADMAGEKLLDIGSGAGFPGLVLGIVSRETAVTLLESDLKKSTFLAETAAEMDLKNVIVLRKRAEDAGKDPAYREQFTAVTSRAVAATRIMLEYAIPFLKVGGALYLWKGPKAEEEVAEAAKALEVLHAELTDTFRYTLGDTERCILQFIKTAPTEAQYPRRTGIPTKRPL